MKTSTIENEVASLDVRGMERELREALEGEVRFDNGSKALYAADGSNYRMIPIGVVIPRHEKDIKRALAICHKYKAPFLSRGGGTSLAGQCCNIAVVVDYSKYYNEFLELNVEKKLVRVQTGIVLDDMRRRTEADANLTFGPDPATHSHCTLGGMLGNNSCGIHSVMAQLAGNGARTSDNTHSMRIVTYDGVEMEVGATSDEELTHIIRAGGRKGKIYAKLRALRDKYAPLIRERFPKIPRRVAGYNLDDLLPEKGFNVARALVGSEGTCVCILDATLMLLPKPKVRTLLVVGFPDAFTAGAEAPLALKHGPIGLEGFDEELIGFMKKKGLDTEDLPLLPKGGGWLLIEFGGDSKEETDAKARKLMTDYARRGYKDANLFDDPKQEKKLWEIRESGLGATAFVPGMADAWPGWEDSAVDPEHLGDYLKDLRQLLKKYDYHASLYGHYGQGCIHCRIDFDLVTEKGVETYRKFTEEGAEIVLRYGGSISGEHGDGQARGDLLERMFGPELMQAFREFKEIWDPDWKMNPGKVVENYGQLANLRLGTNYRPPEVETHFHYPDDQGSFARATLRCVGVGKCRRSNGGTMCPSYMVTKEEEHSTRGRAHLLFEMMQGQEIGDLWKSEHVKEALDLCLACKGCKGDCPVNVDMATLKSEFLSHYFKRRFRPRTAYAFGLIYWSARLASVAPRLVNFFTQIPPFGNLAKLLAGVTQKRTMPRFARETFREWFRKNERRAVPGRRKVILWADTFNNHFMPQTLIAGFEVLTEAGFQVIVPRKQLCCGRPLYDFGMLDLAKRQLRQIMTTLRREISDGIPIVGLEPSCVAVFRDELGNLFPNDEDAKRLKKQTFTLAEFLTQEAPKFLPRLEKKAVVHRHCHHQAVMKFEADEKLMKRMGLDFEILDSGCCGMAGYFGYEQGEHYDVSVAAGERVLLPAVRKQPDGTLIMADGFSCREQIEQQTGRKPLHLAEVIQQALHR